MSGPGASSFERGVLVEETTAPLDVHSNSINVADVRTLRPVRFLNGLRADKLNGHAVKRRESEDESHTTWKHNTAHVNMGHKGTWVRGVLS
jgi:hypothetical protein